MSFSANLDEAEAIDAKGEGVITLHNKRKNAKLE